MWNVDTGLLEGKISHSTEDSLTTVSWSPDGRKITCGGSRGKIFLIHVQVPNEQNKQIWNVHYQITTLVVVNHILLNFLFIIKQDNFTNVMPKAKCLTPGKVSVYNVCPTEEMENQFWRQIHIIDCDHIILKSWVTTR